MNNHRNLLLALALTVATFGVVIAAPLLGGTGSFYESVFCRFYLCQLTARQLIATDLEEFRYVTSDGAVNNPNEIPTPGRVVVVVRAKGKIISGGTQFAAQDDIFRGDNDFAVRLIESLTGVRVNDNFLPQLEQRAQKAAQKEVRVPIGNVNQKMFVSMLISTGEYANAVRVSLRVSR